MLNHLSDHIAFINHKSDGISVLPPAAKLKPFHAGLGNTPLLEITYHHRDKNIKIYAKYEAHNPTGTVKDRTAYAMLWNIIINKNPQQLQSIKIIEYSGGSLAKSLSYLCAPLKLSLTLVLSNATPKSFLNYLQHQGSQLVLVDKDLGFWGLMTHAKALSLANPSWYFLNQHENPANLAIHELSTGREILEAIPERRIDAWIAAIGTGATLIGVYNALAKKYPAIKMYAVTPEELPYASFLPPNAKQKILGAGGLGHGRKQPLVGPIDNKITQHFHCSYQMSLNIMREFYLKTRIRIGSSAAANLWAAIQVADQLENNAVITTIFPSAGSEEEWQKVGLPV